MIKVNGIEVKAGHFPDGTLEMLHIPYSFSPENKINISWQYEKEEELVELIYLVEHYKEHYGKNHEYILFMPYIPNARMDRVKNYTEVFTLKYFTKIINSLNFDSVYVLDAHSDVSLALINNLVKINVESFISDTIQDIISNNPDKEIVVYFPDNGAYKRYKDMHCLYKYKKVFGQKVRDWNTGTILGLKIVDENNEEIYNNSLFKDKVIVMIDDIISYGGTFYYSVNEIKKFNPYKIYAYATHTEKDSLWNGEKGKLGKYLMDKTVEKLYTTDSIYIGNHQDYVKVWNI